MLITFMLTAVSAFVLISAHNNSFDFVSKLLIIALCALNIVNIVKILTVKESEKNAGRN